jgi:hypothetical protein
MMQERKVNPQEEILRISKIIVHSNELEGAGSTHTVDQKMAAIKVATELYSARSSKK